MRMKMGGSGEGETFMGIERERAWLAGGIFAAVVAASAGDGGRAAADESGMVVIAYERAQFVPLSPSRPDGPQVAVLWGEPAQGPSAMYLKMRRGPSLLHVHTADYDLVLIEGRMKHWAAGDKEADAPELGPGSYWRQPGGQAHADSCLADVCVMFVKWAGPRDGRLADEAK
jgi:hypothetical protein